MTELERAAAYINTSTTGCIATVLADVVSVQVPGILSLPGGKTTRFYSTEVVRTFDRALKLVASMK
jgi:hypothetical protein